MRVAGFSDRLLRSRKQVIWLAVIIGQGSVQPIAALHVQAAGRLQAKSGKVQEYVKWVECRGEPQRYFLIKSVKSISSLSSLVVTDH